MSQRVTQDNSAFRHSIVSRCDEVLTPAHAAFLRTHAMLLYSFMNELAHPQFDPSVERAAVIFDREGRCFRFLINSTFWASIGFMKQCFILAHEIMHVLRKHCQREQVLIEEIKQEGGQYQLLTNDLLNVIQDIEINEGLVSPAYGFDRALMQFEGGLCFVDTVFPKEVLAVEQLPLNETFEFYARVWLKHQHAMDVECSAEKVLETHGYRSVATGTEGPAQAQAQHSEHQSRSWESVMQEQALINQFLGDDITDEDLLNNTHPSKGKSGSYSNENFGQFTVKVEVTRSLDDVFAITLRTVNKRSKERESKASWSRPNNRLYDVMKRINPGVTLPGSLRVPIKPEQEKLKILVYMDTSGSCFDYIKRMLSLIKNLPEDKYELYTYIFAGTVEAIDLKEPKFFSGGTWIENVYEHAMELSKEIKFDGVFVLTDGEFSNVHENYSINFRNWFWYLVPTYDTSALPQISEVFRVTEFDQ
jgi:hypothetical protein